MDKSNDQRRRSSRRRRCIAVVLCTIGVVLGLARDAHGMRRVRQPYPGGNAYLERVIRETWPAELQSQALDVAHCESRGKPAVHNGSHRGLFQMGINEWRKYGQGNDVYDGHDNSAAAFRMWTDRGWAAWECAPRSSSSSSR